VKPVFQTPVPPKQQQQKPILCHLAIANKLFFCPIKREPGTVGKG
jgi:hypothetical protein